VRYWHLTFSGIETKSSISDIENKLGSAYDGPNLPKFGVLQSSDSEN